MWFKKSDKEIEKEAAEKRVKKEVAMRRLITTERSIIFPPEIPEIDSKVRVTYSRDENEVVVLEGFVINRSIACTTDNDGNKVASQESFKIRISSFRWGERIGTQDFRFFFYDPESKSWSSENGDLALVKKLDA